MLSSNDDKYFLFLRKYIYIESYVSSQSVRVLTNLFCSSHTFDINVISEISFTVICCSKLLLQNKSSLRNPLVALE